jgi:hypothetical protein
MCGLVCPSRTSECEGKGYCMKGGWREEEERVKERVSRSVNPIPIPNPDPKQAPREMCWFIHEVTPLAPKKPKHAEAGLAHYTVVLVHILLSNPATVVTPAVGVKGEQQGGRGR